MVAKDCKFCLGWCEPELVLAWCIGWFELACMHAIPGIISWFRIACGTTLETVGQGAGRIKGVPGMSWTAYDCFCCISCFPPDLPRAYSLSNSQLLSHQFRITFTWSLMRLTWRFITSWFVADIWAYASRWLLTGYLITQSRVFLPMMMMPVKLCYFVMLLMSALSGLCPRCNLLSRYWNSSIALVKATDPKVWVACTWTCMCCLSWELDNVWTWWKPPSLRMWWTDR